MFFYTPHFVIAFIFVYIVRFVQQRLSAVLILRHIPGPKNSSWLWGEEQNLYYSSSPGSLYLEWHRRFGRVIKFTGAFGHQVLSITDPRAVSFILGEGVYQFPKPDGVRAWFGTLLGEGILWVEGKDAHEKQRRAVAPALSPQSARNMTTMFYDNATRMVTQWHRLFDAGQSDELTIEMTNWAGRYALDTIGRAAFSYDFDCLRGQPHALAETLDSLTNHEKSRSSFYMRALFWIAPWILHLGKKGQMIRKTRKELGELATNILKDAKLAADPSGKTLMSLMLKADKLASVELMDEGQIAAQMRTIISAGYEPVSAALSWVLYELAMNPDRQQAIREEIAIARDPSYDELNNKFPLLDAFFLETLRTHPPVLENHHQASETISVPLAEPLPGTTDLHVIIPKGTILVMPVNVIQKDSLVWGPDADVFRPERWSQRNFRGTRDLFAFSVGPRGCLGRNFAVTEIKALAVTLLHNFAFSCPYEIEGFQSFVIRPRVVGQSASSLPLVVRRLAE
ncbi:cytochrome P450 [Hygrophoropsis aurantiaca]|uniref:Cytochrome P450 n=1 Tax=Hygrophoropsis aurantiaca TaxID=72124 RepID=A0ACB8AN87_9AGAM|nr:cytochrome P450 [Hygrophoropsis aurantiaca]